MNNYTQGDEKRIDRLSSFLYQKGKLDCTKIVPIKSHVYRIKTPQGAELIAKQHPKLNVLEQQWNFFEKTHSPIINAFQRFPNGEKYIKHQKHYWTLAPFIHGRKLNYANEADRQAGLTTLRKFHEDAKSITVTNPIKRQLFYIRWSHRLTAFKETGHFFQENGFETLFRDIIRTTEIHLRQVSQLPWKKIVQKAEKRGEWVHGDVAGHNFIRGEGIWLIDFDLLSRFPVLYDYIQLGQRFLPYLDWDFDELLTHQMVPENQLKLWVIVMMVPSDVLREWLHYLQSGSAVSIDHYLSTMETEWLKRQSFLKKAKTMLKST